MEKYSRIIIGIPIVYVLFILFFMYRIANNLSEPISWCPDLSKEGFDYFAYLFSVPLKMLWRGMVVYGIFVATFNLYQAYKQFNENKNQFDKQFTMHQQNIYINNYYKHKDEFVQYVGFALQNLNLPNSYKRQDDMYLNKVYYVEIDNNKFKISDYIISQLFYIWFWHIKDNKNELIINKNTLLNVKQLYNEYIVHNNILSEKPKPIAETEINVSIINNIGLSSIIFKNDTGVNSAKIKVIFTVCKAILEFDNVSIDNDKKIYEYLKLS